MIKTFTVTKEFQHSKVYCDYCGQEITTRYRSHTCEICRKDICPKCEGHEDDFGGDHPDVWCKRCWDIGTIYRAEIKNLEDKIEEVRKMWEARCKND
jgi:methionyl-tRNA synthetase